MSKTQFVNGVIVTPEWLNSHYHTDGGHVHDGGDGDGHAKKINLSTEAAGLLLLSHTASFIEAYDVPAFKHGTTTVASGSLRIIVLRTPIDGVSVVFCEPTVNFWDPIISSGGSMPFVDVYMPGEDLRPADGVTVPTRAYIPGVTHAEVANYIPNAYFNYSPYDPSPYKVSLTFTIASPLDTGTDSVRVYFQPFFYFTGSGPSPS